MIRPPEYTAPPPAEKAEISFLISQSQALELVHHLVGVMIPHVRYCTDPAEMAKEATAAQSYRAMEALQFIKQLLPDAVIGLQIHIEAAINEYEGLRK